MRKLRPDKNGFYGIYGGAFIPEMLYANIKELQDNYMRVIRSNEFRKEFSTLLRDFAGRPTPLFFSEKLSSEHKAEIFLKREDLNHTGAHKITNAIGQVLLARQLKKKRIIAETGAGQHGVATATACAMSGMECTVFMGEIDMQRQKANVEKMKLLGANVVAVRCGSKTLKDSINEALREWIRNPADSHYLIGSAVGPHPYPDMLACFQSVISREIKFQLKQITGREAPDYVIACLGGGSNAIGAFYHFIGNGKTKLIAVEAAGKGIETGKTAATIAKGRRGIIHGCMTYLLQDSNGQITEPYSVSAGLDYPGIGPVHAFLHDEKKIVISNVTDEEAIAAGIYLSGSGGIIPALESAHALAYLKKIKFRANDLVVVNLSGRGDKDIGIYNRALP
ncbi:MAG: tryptophan synthase subunit beta [Bacteroidota bacterium]